MLEGPHISVFTSSLCSELRDYAKVQESATPESPWVTTLVFCRKSTTLNVMLQSILIGMVTVGPCLLYSRIDHQEGYMVSEAD
jgi:hypothetical protein